MRRFRSLFGLRPDADVDHELAFHLEMRTRELIDRGVPPDRARELALRRFGDYESERRACVAIDERRRWKMVWLRYFKELRQDVRYGLRTMRRTPGFTAAAIVTLALGIGANTAIFSVMDAAYFSRYPLHEPDRLLRVYGEDRASGSTQLGFSWPRFLFYREHQTAFERFSAVTYNGVALEDQNQAEQIPSAAMTSDFLDTFGARPLAGRFMRSDEETGGRVVVLGENLWRTRYGSSESVIGQTVRLSGTVYTIIGVAPRLPAFWDADVWLPDPFVLPGVSRDLLMRGVTFLAAVGRLRPGVTQDQATQEVQALAERYRAGFAGNADSAWVASTVGLREDIVGAARSSLLTMLAAVGLLFVVACANVANLLLVRFTGRGHEIGVRAALGASRLRLVRQFLIESALLSAIAAIAGAALAYASLPALVELADNNLAFSSDIAINVQVLAATAVLALAAGLLMGVYPALQSSRADIVTALRDGSRTVAGAAGSQRVRHAIVAAQVAVSLVLLIGATLLVASFLRLQAQPAGFGATDAFIASVNLPASRYPDAGAQDRFYTAVADALEQSPGVTRAVVAQNVPLLGPITRAPYASAEGAIPPLNERPLGLTESVTPGYFETLQIPLLAGRDFTDRDTAGSPLVAIVSASTARRLFPHASEVLGRRIIMGSAGGGQVMEIIGVAADVRSVTLMAPPDVEFYRPVSQRPRTFMRIVVRTAGEAGAFEHTARQLVSRLDPSLPVTGATTLKRVLDQSIAPQRLLFTLLVVFAALAVVLSVVGIYGVVAYFVGQRTQEIGVRLALGASRREIAALVLRQALRPVALGLVIGLTGAAGLSRFVQSLLFQVSALDPLMLAGAAVCLAAVAAMACALPARRAAYISPITALRD